MTQHNLDSVNHKLTGFSKRLKHMIGERTVSEFARQVRLSESLIRKYLKGSEPSLSKAVQIACYSHVNLMWLAQGVGSMTQQYDEVYKPALFLAKQVVEQLLCVYPVHLSDNEQLVFIFKMYQFMTTQPGYPDVLDAQKARLYASSYLQQMS